MESNDEQETSENDDGVAIYSDLEEQTNKEEQKS